MKKKETNTRTSKKIRTGDTVMAIAGNFRGQTGEVMSVEGDKITVRGINVRKKHVKRSQLNPQGGIVEREYPIHRSNVMVCVNNDVPVRLHVKCDKNGERHLAYNDGGKEVVYRTLKQTKK
ncbi:MAG: 50S ribosomal protein L24 [Chlamydiales bacterium]|nr:50S ribosomal protein L24 [Chlamydiia bacterium]MCP5506892.1 50S ribosomal protein L24 [Chlamydiales bacterium]